MSRDAFLSKALYEADKSLEEFVEKFATAPRECAFTRWWTEQTMNRKYMFHFIILHIMNINGLHLFLCLYSVDCCIAANR